MPWLRYFFDLELFFVWSGIPFANLLYGWFGLEEQIHRDSWLPKTFLFGVESQQNTFVYTLSWIFTWSWIRATSSYMINLTDIQKQWSSSKVWGAPLVEGRCLHRQASYHTQSRHCSSICSHEGMSWMCFCRTYLICLPAMVVSENIHQYWVTCAQYMFMRE